MKIFKTNSALNNKFYLNYKSIRRIYNKQQKSINRKSSYKLNKSKNRISINYKRDARLCNIDKKYFNKKRENVNKVKGFRWEWLINKEDKNKKDNKKCWDKCNYSKDKEIYLLKRDMIKGKNKSNKNKNKNNKDFDRNL
jgi:hypothetical protein